MLDSGRKYEPRVEMAKEAVPWGKTVVKFELPMSGAS